MKTQGRYFIKAGSNTNAPINTWIYVEVDVVDDTRMRQIVWADNSGRNTFKRTWTGSSWTAWEREVAINELTPINANIANSLKLHAMITNGKLLFPDVNFRQGMNSVVVYNNAGGDGVVIERIPKRSNNPTSSTHELKVTRKVGKTTSPSLGGFYQMIQSAPNKVFLIKYLICLPTGYSLVPNANATGNGRIDMFIGSTSGTGKYETYLRFIQCGDSGSFSTTGFVSINGTAPTTANLEWYIAQIETYEITDYVPAITESRVNNLISTSKQFTDAEVKFLKDLYLKSTDTDRDGLSDYDEINVHKTSPTKADTDDDTWTDLEEVTRNTDPLVVTPRTTALITGLHTYNRSGDTINVYATVDVPNKQIIESVRVIVEDSDSQTITTERILSNLTYASDTTVLIPINPVEWLNQDVPNHGFSGNQQIRYRVYSASGLEIIGNSAIFTF